ncbi:MAG: hypothetical protein ACYC7J_13870 [Syntrophales bacterium]
MECYDLDGFLKISALLNYQLSARQPNWSNITYILLEGKQLSPREQALLLCICDYLGKIYGKRKRELGPLSVLHPLRATALLCHASKELDLLDVITCLLHDHFEDFDPLNDPHWIKQEQMFHDCMAKISETRRKRLLEYLAWLTKEPAETYNHYIGHLLDQARNAPEVVRVKLADRLDNTFDMRIDLQDPLKGVDFFEIVFQTMFTHIYKGYRPERIHQTTLILNGAQRLYQLFKNIVLMSLVRQRKAGATDTISQGLFQTLAEASMREAQRITLHIFGYHETSVSTLRAILKETMEYAESGGLEQVTLPQNGRRLDGLFMSVFDKPNRAERNKQLAALYQNKPLMIEVAVSFVIIFLNFLNDAEYFVHGISSEGIRPEAR